MAQEPGVDGRMNPLPSLTIDQKFKYLSTSWWEWSVWVDGSIEDLDQIKCVEYNLGPTFSKPVRTIEDRTSKFLLKEASSGGFTISARAIHKKGGETLLKHELELLDDSGNTPKPPASSMLERSSIPFPNQRARIVFASADDVPGAIVRALEIRSYRAVMLVLGSARDIDQAVVPKLTQLFVRGVARAGVEAGAVIIDGGTGGGVVAMMGEGVAGRGYKSRLIGVAPLSLVSYPGGPEAAGAVPLEPNHSDFVLVDGNTWGSETTTMFNLVKALTSASTPGVSILAGGGRVSKDEVLRVVRQGIPIIVVNGSGGLADEIAAAWQQRVGLPDDPVMAEIIADGDIHVHQLPNLVEGIARLIKRLLGENEVLMRAWETFADYDFNANHQQRRFGRIQLWTLIVGVAGTLLAIGHQVFGPKNETGKLRQLSWADLDSRERVLWWIVAKLLIL